MVSHNALVGHISDELDLHQVPTLKVPPPSTSTKLRSKPLTHGPRGITHGRYSGITDLGSKQVSASTVLMGKCCGLLFLCDTAVSVLNSEQWGLLGGTFVKSNPINFPTWRKKGLPPAPLKDL